ncbi:uncharacterized protein BDZ99DRAFT_464554 [Mytilinidion resinicola]|uniref:Uncharacterized protein n=1 Tax=Mytilinidion resinicola TaxID=574789 RepID=A0A6A6YI10_9PEZI|nr:uncharacterized protein BDZ99DRAFT_464554 [Mytilinidion resinicola]KAF2807625.1 hypothetical protein BDZ99DRAFT_464554 [Mytilinidion resinicola]
MAVAALRSEGGVWCYVGGNCIKLRDNFESKKEGLEKQLTDILGETWKIDINPNAIWAYAEDDSYGKDNLGACLHSYIADTIWNLKYFLEKHGDLGKTELNTVATAHTLTLALDTTGSVSYASCDIHDGTLRLLFQEGNLGTNISQTTKIETLEAALCAANPDAAALSYSARLNIAQVWDAKLPDLQKKIAAQLANDKIVLDPNFAAVYATLKAAPGVAKERPDWEKSLGYIMHQYFSGLLHTLEYQKFEKDDMLQEGFAEAVEKGEIRFRVVEKLGRTYNESVVEDGVFWLQTKPDMWGTNCGDVASDVVNLL